MNASMKVVGIMTGNSMDGVDCVLTQFGADGSMKDLLTHGEQFPVALASRIRKLREVLSANSGNVAKSEAQYGGTAGGDSLDAIHHDYITTVASAVSALKLKSERAQVGQIDLVGLHGQTCGHCPPSVAGDKEPYTLQLGDGQALADALGITVVHDFRSSDVMDGGEGAPLAPMHHKLLAEDTKRRGVFPIAFINAGNTGNISVITKNVVTGGDEVIGWDSGPFNHFPDMLARREAGMELDVDGRIGSAGKVSKELLKILFDGAAVTGSGGNFFNTKPPRSSDPQWYKFLPELAGQKALPSGVKLSLADRMRTVEYLAAYALMHTLTLVSEDLALPKHYGLCGGGWNNKLIANHFIGLLNGNFKDNPVLPEHLAAFEKVISRIGKDCVCQSSNEYGFDGAAMESRIFAHAAWWRIMGKPFTLPSTTKVRVPCICGVINFPAGMIANATPSVQSAIRSLNSLGIPGQRMDFIDRRFGRAIPGWSSGKM